MNINFIPKTKEIELVVPPPRPASEYFPQWLKEIPLFENSKFKVETLADGTNITNATAKACMPFMDTFLTGYIQETWCDILIERNNDEIIYKYSRSPTIISNRDKISISKMVDSSFYPIEFLWQQPWIPKTPPGYSMLYLHPLNRLDLPFFSLSGIIENDLYHIEDAGNHPFFIKKDFEGIIPAGTPMFQMIPIKRENWKSTVNQVQENWNILKSNVYKYFYGGYRRLYWKKKSYK
jgi:hypothetical protein